MGGMGGMGGMMGDPAQMQQMLQNPAVQEMMRSPGFQQQMQAMLQDPAMIQQMAAMNPALATPQMQQMLTNPQFLQAMTNPDVMNAMMQMQSAMGTLQGAGLAPGMLGAQDPSIGATTTPAPAQPNPSTAPAANPWGAFGMSGFPAAAVPPAPAQDPQLMYQSQLSQLVEMGFGDPAANLRALLATGGNVNAAIEYLLNNP